MRKSDDAIVTNQGAQGSLLCLKREIRMDVAMLSRPARGHGCWVEQSRHFTYIKGEFFAAFLIAQLGFPQDDAGFKTDGAAVIATPVLRICAFFLYPTHGA